MKVEVYIQHRRVISVISLTTALEKPLEPPVSASSCPRIEQLLPFRHPPLLHPQGHPASRSLVWGVHLLLRTAYTYGMPHWMSRQS